MVKKASDFRYNTGATRVPWAAVGENYNAQDLMAVIRFLAQGEGEEYEKILGKISEEVEKLTQVSSPPGKLSLGTQVEKAEEMVDKYLGSKGSLFVTNCTEGFEIAFKYANLKPGDEVIVPAITFIATMAYPLEVGAKVVFADVDREREYGSCRCGSQNHSENENDCTGSFGRLSRGYGSYFGIGEKA